MWSFIAACLVSAVTSDRSPFQQHRIIFASDFHITSILAPADANTMIMESPDIPTIFFTVDDPKSEGGSCIYVLQGLSAYELLEGGRDTTSDYSFDDAIYFGARNGIYKYDSETLSAKKYGPFRDDIKQIQKANGTDDIYFLSNENQLFRVRSNGTIRDRVSSVPCAKEFVLDTSNNIYFVSCEETLPYIFQSGGRKVIAANILEDLKEVKLLRPAFLMQKCVPFIGDGNLYILYMNGTYEKKILALDEQPSAFSVDAGFYAIVALDGKIYEFNVMDVLLQSIVGEQESIWDLTMHKKTRSIGKKIISRPIIDLSEQRHTG